jgi:hypothetical protein
MSCDRGMLTKICYSLLLQNGNGYHQYSLARVTFSVQGIETYLESNLWIECDPVLHLSGVVRVSHHKLFGLESWTLSWLPALNLSH